MIAPTHFCLICGQRLHRYDGLTGEVVPVCARCGERVARVHDNWFRPGPIEVEAMKEQSYKDAYAERKAAA